MNPKSMNLHSFMKYDDDIISDEGQMDEVSDKEVESDDD